MSSSIEKEGEILPSSNQSPASAPQSQRRNYSIWVVLIICSIVFPSTLLHFCQHPTSDQTSNNCPQVNILTPEKNGKVWTELNDKIGSAAFKQTAIDWLAGAVQVPTESYDNMDPVGVDPRYEAFAPFHAYLSGAFPLVHATLQLTKVNTYALWYEWKGSDVSLKPLLLAAHQDVVPVHPDTVSQWVHPPYAGIFDGEKVWGRGAHDDKAGLIGILSTIESLLEAKFQPRRTVVLAFGFDEESAGFQGAGHLGPALESAYGENGIAMIVDEGSGFSNEFGSIIARPGIGEKGRLAVLVEVTAPGGHSSVPPAHTSIGILSALLVNYEQNPYKVKLRRNEPVFATLQCVAEHAKVVPSNLRRMIKKSVHSDKALESLQSFVHGNEMLHSLVTTTQAIDLIQGGVKSNALPELAWAVVDHRISVLSSVSEVRAHDAALVKHLAGTFNLTYSAFGTQISEEGAPASGTLTLSDAFRSGLEPAPITPTGVDAAPYQLLSGTIKATYNAHRSIDDTDIVIVAPGLMSGNTDTRFYWKLSQHIFRYNHDNIDEKNPRSGIHGVNEYIIVDTFLEKIRFFSTLILNADEAELL